MSNCVDLTPPIASTGPEEHRWESPTGYAPTPAPLNIRKSRVIKAIETEKTSTRTSPSASDYIKDVVELRATLIFEDDYKLEYE